MSAPRVTTEQGFRQYASGVSAMVHTDRITSGTSDTHQRVIESVNAMKACGFDDDELRAMLAIAIDMVAFPDEWKAMLGE